MLNRSASLAMSTSILKALPGKLDIKRHSPSILYVLAWHSAQGFEVIKLFSYSPGHGLYPAQKCIKNTYTFVFRKNKTLEGF